MSQGYLLKADQAQEAEPQGLEVTSKEEREKEIL